MKNEANKVLEINPQIYILATSLPLSPDNKEKIYNLLPTFFNCTDNIFGGDDINNLLGQYPEVEKQHFKLWLSSTAILEKIIHSGIINESNDKHEEIRDKIKLYVQNESFNNSIKILKKFHYLIISGIPGIGKTTLADILAFYYADKEFEFIKITNNIEQAWNLLERGKKQLFYYDDFLGKVSLSEKLAKNEDKSIIRLMKNVEKYNNKRFILTTREYLLNQARSVHEELNNRMIDVAKCTISLGNYTKIIKAKILYNHLYFADIDDNFRLEILKDGFYNKIINHSNYNPRLIEFVTNKYNLQCMNNGEYNKFILKTLNNPSELWDYAFKKQISKISKHLLLIMLMHEKEVIDNIREYLSEYSEEEFKDSLKELEGSFVMLNKNTLMDDIYITFHNPSVIDYLHNQILDNQEHLEYLISKSKACSNLENLWGKPFTQPTAIRKVIIKNPSNFIAKMESFIESEIWIDKYIIIILDIYNETRNTYCKSLLFNTLNRLNSCAVNDISNLLQFARKINELQLFTAEEKDILINNLKHSFTNECLRNRPNIYTLFNTAKFFKENPSYIDDHDRQSIQELLGEYDDNPTESGLNTEDELENYLEETKFVEKYFEVNLSHIIDYTKDKIDEIKEENREPDDDSYEASGSSSFVSYSYEIDDMFSPETLISNKG